MKNFLIVVIFLFLISASKLVLASQTDGTIDSVYKYAWGEKTGWINFGCDHCNVHITDSGLTGYIWSENFGWINLSPTNGGVLNNGEGNLSGYAWGENLGWINFDNVRINSEGRFTGTAYGEIAGVINFDCENCKVLTDWRPISVRPRLYGSRPPFSEQIAKLQEIYLSLLNLLIENLKQTAEKVKPIITKPIVIKPFKPKPEEIPSVFEAKWKLLSYTLKNKNFVEFTLAPLPEEFQVLAEKFPQLGKTFAEVGIRTLFDIQKLRPVKLTLPGLTERIGFPPVKFTLPSAVPLAKLPSEVKEEIPTDVVFVRTAGELIDVNTILSVTEKGELQQKIYAIAGQTLKLVIRPEKPVKSIKGYLVFKTRKIEALYEMPLSNLTASLIFANPVLAQPFDQPIEEKLVLKEFEYKDEDGDGIYTAEIKMPMGSGEYEIITLIDYDDPQLGKKAIRLITAVDPKGYVYEKYGDKELRISGAIVSLYWLNLETKKYELWPAQKYQQENPQVTDVSGNYLFLVPPGFYYLKVEAPGYLTYQSKPFEVKRGSGIHMNIELKSKYWWLKEIDWKVVIIILLALLLAYNFYRDKIREVKLKEYKFIQESRNE